MSLVDDDPGPQYSRKRSQPTGGMSARYATARKRVRQVAKKDFAAKAALGAAYLRTRTLSARTASRAMTYGRSTGELKGVDTDLDLSTILATTNTNADVFTTNLIVPGNGSWNRIGRKIFPRTLRIWGSALHTYSLTATTNNINANTLRMVVVWDRNPNGAALPAFDAIFGRTVQAGTESCEYMDPLRYDGMDRFRILKDTHFVPQVGATPPLAGTQNLVRDNFQIDEFIQLPAGTETLYGGQSDPQTIADIQSGALYIWFRCGENSASNFWSIVNGCCRLRYTDT